MTKVPKPRAKNPYTTEKSGKAGVLTAVIAGLILGFINLSIASVFVMWALDIANDSDTRVPAFGFWTVFALVLAVRWALPDRSES